MVAYTVIVYRGHPKWGPAVNAAVMALFFGLMGGAWRAPVLLHPYLEEGEEVRATVPGRSIRTSRTRLIPASGIPSGPIWQSPCGGCTATLGADRRLAVTSGGREAVLFHTVTRREEAQWFMKQQFPRT
ncbi:hypothetical protein [Streptomyces sp. E11-3]|uniref:hypothetical protein n=1 Tax=Streptomyces sp. E11-3 TaxID=3110112 RepID=UPI00397F1DF8